MLGFGSFKSWYSVLPSGLVQKTIGPWGDFSSVSEFVAWMNTQVAPHSSVIVTMLDAGSPYEWGAMLIIRNSSVAIMGESSSVVINHTSGNYYMAALAFGYLGFSGLTINDTSSISDTINTTGGWVSLSNVTINRTGGRFLHTHQSRVNMTNVTSGASCTIKTGQASIDGCVLYSLTAKDGTNFEVSGDLVVDDLNVYDGSTVVLVGDTFISQNFNHLTGKVIFAAVSSVSNETGAPFLLGSSSSEFHLLGDYSQPSGSTHNAFDLVSGSRLFAKDADIDIPVGVDLVSIAGTAEAHLDASVTFVTGASLNTDADIYDLDDGSVVIRKTQTLRT